MNIKEVQIGYQVWMVENLNVSHFQNGAVIPEVTGHKEWKEYGEESKPAWCYYDNDPANGDKYGKLYNWYAVIHPGGLAPGGWHIPGDEEWTRLIKYLGGFTLAGEKLAFTNKSVKGLPLFYQIGFNALPGGYRKLNGFFSYLGYCGFWWSSTERIPDNAWVRYIYFNNHDVNRGSFNKKSGFSVRCLRD